MSNRRLAAIMFTDIAGYTAMMQEDEARAITLRTRHREVFEREHANHRGNIIQYYGDGTLSVFDSAVDAAACAVAMQRQFAEAPQVPLRIGIHTGDIIINETEVIGDGVNVASRVESIAIPGSVLVSETVYDNLKNQPDFPGRSLGKFTFKNVTKPIEVFSLTSEGLKNPDPKQLSGKFLKRESAQPNMFQRLPVWAQYAVGLVAFLILAPFIYSPITSLFDANASNGAVEGTDAFSNRDAIAFSQKKRIIQVPFEVAEKDSGLKWAEIMLPTIIDMDWQQDPYMYSIFEHFAPRGTFKEYVDKAQENRCEWIMEGEITQVDSVYQIGVTLSNINNRGNEKTLSFEGPKLLPLIDRLTREVKVALGVPESHLKRTPDLEIEDFLTSSEEAAEAFGTAYSTIPKNPIGGFYLMKEPIEADSTFAWAAFNLANFIKIYQLSEAKAKEYIALAMRHRERLPDVLQLRVRQLSFRLNGEPEKALQLTRLFVEQEPDNPKHLRALIEESLMQRDYEEALKAIEQYRGLEGVEGAYLQQKAYCLLILDRPEEALEAAEAYLKENPNQENGLQTKGEVLIALEKWDDAADLFSRAELLFPDNEMFPRFTKHVSAAIEGQIPTQETLDRLIGEYGSFQQASYRAPILMLGKRLTFDLKEYQPLGLYYAGDDLEFFTNQGQRIEFEEDSNGVITSYVFHNDRFNLHQRHHRREGSVKKVIDALVEEDFEAVAAHLSKAQEERPDLKYLNALEAHLALDEAERKPDSVSVAPYIGSYTDGEVTLIIRYQNGGLYVALSRVEWAADPKPLLFQEEDTFLYTEVLLYYLQFKRTGKKVTGADLIFFDEDRTVQLTRVE